MKLQDLGRAGSNLCLRCERALPAAAELVMAAAVAIAALLTVALPIVLAVRLHTGEISLDARSLLETLGPISLAWALFAYAGLVLRASAPALTPPPGSRARP